MPSINETGLGDFIEQSIYKNGWSIRKAALQIGVSAAYLSKIINHKADSNPKPQTLDKLSKGLKVPRKELYEAAGLTLINDDSIPAWATEKDITDLNEYLETNKPMNFQGVELDVDAKEAVQQFLVGYFWKRRKQEKNDAHE